MGGFVKDEHFCSHCNAYTMHACQYSDHERDSSGDWFICLTCEWEYHGFTGKYEPPPEGGHGDLLAGLKPSLLKYGQRLLKRDEEEASRDLEVQDSKPEGAPPEDCKRFYLGSTIKCRCPECGYEWAAKSQLVLHVELEVTNDEVEGQ